MHHIPILRAGKPYRSLDRARLRHLGSGETVALVSQANRGLVARDLAAAEANRRALADLSAAQLLGICKEAARLFTAADLPLDEEAQGPEDYLRQTSATTGLPEALCRGNMEKIHQVLAQMEAVLDGLTRGLDLGALDEGWGLGNERPLSYICQTRALGVVLPNNSPGVHSLWAPAIALKVPVALKPGSEEPWTPLRLAQAFMAAGCPPRAFGYYPTDYAGAAEILLRCGRSMLFGADATVEPWKGEPGVQIHGPGRSKIVIAEDEIEKWEDHLDLMAASVVENGGRSCINASGIWVPAHGREIATALAQRLARVEALPLDHPRAQIAAFARPALARRLTELIDRQLELGGAEDLTARFRSGERLVEREGCTFLLPTVLWCEDCAHPLANAEFLFPFVSVVQAPQKEILQRIGPTLVLTAVTGDRGLIIDLLSCAHVERLNLGPIRTDRVSWNQPHEGNLFEFLYRQRALQTQKN